MAIDRKTLDAVKAGERHYETETLPDGSVLRGRTLLRGEIRRQQQFFRDKKKGGIDDDKWQYADDILLAFRLIDDDENLLITPEEALSGYFDNWSQEYIDAAVRLMKRLTAHENRDATASRRDEIMAGLLDDSLSDDDVIALVTQLRATYDKEPIEGIVKNSSETPGNDSSGVSADATDAA